MLRSPRGQERESTTLIKKLGRGDGNGCGTCSECKKKKIHAALKLNHSYKSWGRTVPKNFEKNDKKKTTTDGRSG